MPKGNREGKIKALSRDAPQVFVCTSFFGETGRAVSRLPISLAMEGETLLRAPRCGLLCQLEMILDVRVEIVDEGPKPLPARAFELPAAG
jgi:hypothetical protein